MLLNEKLEMAPPPVREIMLTFAQCVNGVRQLLHTANRKTTGTQNVSGDHQLALDVMADTLFYDAFAALPAVYEFASEERDESMILHSDATYSITLDPLDGSSLLDVNLSVGSILGIWRGPVLSGTLVASAYVVYGPATILVLSVGTGVSEFILRDGAYICLQESIKLKEKGDLYSIGGLRRDWLLRHAAFIDALEQEGYKLRYSGCLVPDVHQILLKGGGLFTYPALENAPTGKLRLLFELYPLSFIVSQAGGDASDGKQPILSSQRISLHQKSPIYLGSRKEVEQARVFMKT